MVEGARLERVYTGNRIEGSNPSLSANRHDTIWSSRQRDQSNWPDQRPFFEVPWYQLAKWDPQKRSLQHGFSGAVD